MCIAIIKKTKEGFIVGFNRDEMFTRPWKNIGKNWSDHPDVTGYLDKQSGGSWLAYNDNGILAFVLNRSAQENDGKLLSRGMLILELLSNTESISEAIRKLYKIKLDAIRPFNLIIMNSRECYYYSNINYTKAVCLKSKLVMLNKGIPNDMREERIRYNWSFFASVNCKDDIKQFKDKMLETSSAINGELTMSLEGEQWKTLSHIILRVEEGKEITYETF